MTTAKPNKEIKKWAEKTTMHGITNILETENWLKRLIYVSLILGAFGMVGYYVHARLVDFMSFDVVTSYRKVAYVNNSVQFPNIAICNRNRFFLNKNAAKSKFFDAKTGLKNLLGVSRKRRSIDSLQGFLNETGINAVDPYATRYIYGDITTDWVSELKSFPEYASKRSTYTGDDLKKFDNMVDDAVKKMNLSMIKYYAGYEKEDYLLHANEMMDLISSNIHSEELTDSGETVDGFANYISSQPSIDTEEDYAYHDTNYTIRRRKRAVLTESSDPKIENSTVSDTLNLMGWKLSKSTVFGLFFRHKSLPLTFLKQIQTEFGNCALFESDHKMVQKTSGDGNGLEVYLNIEHEYYTTNGVHETDEVIDASTEAGVSIYVYHSKSGYIDLRRPINVSPGSLASIGLTEFDYQYMPEPYGDCSNLVKDKEESGVSEKKRKILTYLLTIFSGQVMNRTEAPSIFPYTPEYSLYKCMNDCYMDAIIAECKCRPHYMKKGDYSVVPECTFADYFNSPGKFPNRVDATLVGSIRPK